MTRTTLTRLTTLSRHIAHRLQWTTTGTGSCCASDGMNGKTKVKPRALLATLSPVLRVAFALTIVVFTSDNGAEIVSWPDGGNTPFKGEKGTTWEGGMRVPGMVRWPGVVKPGTIVNDIISQEDWTATFLAAAGDPDVKTKLLTGFKAGDKTFKTHLDGYNFMPFFKGEVAKGPRQEIFYFDDSANLNAVRVQDWKLSFRVMEGNLLTSTSKAPNMPIVCNLRLDPFERYSTESAMWMRWASDKLWTFVPARRGVPRLLQGVPAEPEVGQLQRGSGAKATHGYAQERQLTQAE